MYAQKYIYRYIYIHVTQFRLVNDSTMTPPWCVTLTALGHTFATGKYRRIFIQICIYIWTICVGLLIYSPTCKGFMGLHICTYTYVYTYVYA
jgi:hypothetical protein